jgi:hypothetical protein
MYVWVMKRLINRRQQGDLGEASAIEWLTRSGARVWAPLGHSPDADLIAERDGRMLRVQVKTSTCRTQALDGTDRWNVALATNGGNQSWNRVAKTFDPSRFELLFVLVGDGRRWLIPADAIEATRGLNLGGTKYSEFEIERGGAIDDLVYDKPAPLESKSPLGEYPSGQRMRPVKSPAYAFAGSNPASPIKPDPAPTASGDTTRFERKLGRCGQAIIRPKRQTTVPKQPFIESGLRVGERMRVRAEGPGRVVFERIGSTAQERLRLEPDPNPSTTTDPDGRDPVGGDLSTRCE